MKLTKGEKRFLMDMGRPEDSGRVINRRINNCEGNGTLRVSGRRYVPAESLTAKGLIERLFGWHGGGTRMDAGFKWTPAGKKIARALWA